MRWYPGIYPERLRINAKVLLRVADVVADIRTELHPNTNDRALSHEATFSFLCSHELSVIPQLPSVVGVVTHQ
jgi:hypothetical protein